MQQNLSEQDIRLVDILESFGGYLKYMLKKWYILLVGVGGLTYGGYYYATSSDPTYVAYTSFNSPDARMSAMGGMMSMMGMSFSGGSSIDVLNGVFASRNVFYRALLSESTVNNTTEKIGNRYLKIFKYDEGFKEDPKMKNFKFTSNNLKDMTPTEIEVGTILYADFSGGFFTSEYDVLVGVLKAEVETPDFYLSRDLASAMLKETTLFFQDKQLENAKVSLKNSTKRLDSINNEIEKRQKMVAQSQDQNIFNTKKINTIDEQKIMQEIGTLTVMYNDASNTKESAKAGLVIQNNLLRIVDSPEFSTYSKKKSKFLYAIIGFAISILVVIIPLILSKAIKDGREENKQRDAMLKVAADKQATS